MKLYVGLDVSLRETAICVVDGEGRRQWQGRCSTQPSMLISTLRRHVVDPVAVALETGPLAAWLWHELHDAGVPVVCLHARHAHAALKMQINKTDTNDAYGLAQIVRTGWYRRVAIKSRHSYEIRGLLTSRAHLVSMKTSLANQIRGLLKTFGIVVPPGKGRSFVAHVRERLPAAGHVTDAIQALLAAWQALADQTGHLERALIRHARGNQVCRRLMTTPGVGAVTAAAFVAAIDNPERFVHSRDLGAYLGLTPRQYQSGEVDRVGRISKCGDRLLRTYLYEAAHALLTRAQGPSTLRAWGLRIAKRSSLTKATVAVARKIAIVLHRMWVDGSTFAAQPHVCAA